MANNYYDMTGILRLSRVTPIIRALFGDYELDETYPGNGSAYIANISESTSLSWDNVRENLEDLVQEYGLSLPEDAEDCIEELLYLLSEHFKQDGDEELGNFIEHNTFEEEPSLFELFMLASKFDDGHGLHSIHYEGCWYCSKPRLFEFGGHGQYIGKHFSLGRSSNDALTLGEALDTAVAGQDAEAVVSALDAELDRLLAGIASEQFQADVRKLLAAKLKSI
jgi:hypothetical protein